jgi:hypothetical protein
VWKAYATLIVSDCFFCCHLTSQASLRQLLYLYHNAPITPARLSSFYLLNIYATVRADLWLASKSVWCSALLPPVPLGQGDLLTNTAVHNQNGQQLFAQLE